MVEIQAALTSLQAVASGLNALGKIEMAQQVLALQSTLIDFRQQQLELIEEKALLRARIQELETAARVAANLFYRHNAYWQRDPNGTVDGPYSQLAWDRDRKLIRMRQMGREGTEVRYWCSAAEISILIPVAFLQQNGIELP